MMFVAAMVIPFQVVMFPLVKWFKIVGDVLGISRCWVPTRASCSRISGFGCSMSIFILHGFIKNIPLELEEAATIDGCSQARTFFTIVLPLLQPAFITVLILNGIWIWNDFLLPLLILGSSRQGADDPAGGDLVCRLVPQAVGSDPDLDAAGDAADHRLFIFAQRYIIKGMVEGSIK